MLSCNIVARKKDGQWSLFFPAKQILVSLERGVVVAEDLGGDLKAGKAGFVDGMERLNSSFIFVCPALVSDSLITFVDRLVGKEEPSLQLELSLFGAAGLPDPEVSKEEKAAIAELQKLLR
jgi:hypothetical protein